MIPTEPSKMIPTETTKMPSKKNNPKIISPRNCGSRRIEPLKTLPLPRALMTMASLLLLVTVAASAQNHEQRNHQASPTAPVTYLVPSLTPLPTRLPEDIFTEQPGNATLVEGQKVVMRCKTAIPVSYCRWYYLDMLGNFYDHLEKPRLVKEFDPKKKTDCSIRFTKVHPVQEGQWLCEAYGYQSTVKYFTRPGLLRVMKDERNVGFEFNTDISPPSNVATVPNTSPPRVETSSDNNDRYTTRKPQTSNDPNTENKTPTVKNEGSLFQYSEGEYIQNTRTNAMAVLPCQVKGPVETCSWIMPTNLHLMWHAGTKAPITAVDARYYEFAGDKTAGNCSIRIHNVSHQDEGNWRCTVKLVTSREHQRNNDERLGPILHLHLLDVPHGANHKHAGEPSARGWSIGWTIGVIIVLIIVAVFIFILYKMKQNFLYNRQNADIEPKAKVSHENSSFDPDYAQKMFHGRDMKIPAPTYSDNERFMVTGNTNPALPFSLRNNLPSRPEYDQDGQSVRSSANSTSTLMTNLNPDPSRNSESFNSPGRMSNMSNMSPPNFGKANNPQFFRQESSNSAEHVYEEIKGKIQRQASQESYTSIKNPNFMASTPIYKNQLQDQEGYLIPNNSSKILNTPNIVDQDKYLPMTGPTDRRVFSGPKTSQYPIDKNNFNVDHKTPPRDYQINMASEERRLSSDSNLSSDNNLSNESNNPTPKKDSIFPINKYGDSIHFSNVNRSLTPLSTRNSARSLDSLDGASRIKNPATDRLRHLNSSMHVRASSLPNENIPPKRKPSVTLAPLEDYDVPRSPSSFNRKSSQVSLDDINGTVV